MVYGVILRRDQKMVAHRWAGGSGVAENNPYKLSHTSQ